MAFFGVVSSIDINGHPFLSLKVLDYLPDARIAALERERKNKNARIAKMQARLSNIDEQLKQLYTLKEKTKC